MMEISGGKFRNLGGKLEIWRKNQKFGGKVWKFAKKKMKAWRKFENFGKI